MWQPTAMTGRVNALQGTLRAPELATSHPLAPRNTADGKNGR